MPIDPNANQTPPADANKGPNANATPNPNGDGKGAGTQQQQEQNKGGQSAGEGSDTLLGNAQGAKDGGDGKKPDPAGEDLQLKVPEGVKLDEKLLGNFKGWAKEQGLKGEAAQKLVTLFAEHQKAREQADTQLMQKTKEEWVNAVRGDKVLGGANLERTLQVAAKAIDRFDPSGELRKVFNATGFGDHPVFIRVFHAIGKELLEDSLSGAGSNPAKGEPTEQDRLRTRYPSMFKDKTA